MDKPRAPDNPAVDDHDLELPAIEFVAQGTFSIHNPDTSSTSIAWHAAEYRLGEQRDLIQIENMDAVRSHSLALLQQAQQHLCIYTPDLEAWRSRRLGLAMWSTSATVTGNDQSMVSTWGT